MMNKFQEPGEILQQYEADVARLVHLAYSTVLKEFFDRFIVQVFIDGRRDIEIHQTLRLASPTKIGDTLA